MDARSVDSPRRFEEAALRGLRRAALPPGSSILVAVSGGADSTALLLVTRRLALRRAWQVHAAYVDHGLRAAEETDAEQRALHTLCDEIDVPLSVECVDVAGERARRGGSLEAVARRCRYEALGAAARRKGSAAVLTGHTADDQAETVLLRAARGTGIEGLGGIREASRPWGADGPLLLRPLLALRRRDTEAYCRARGAPWSVDSSNASRRFARNRVRLDVLPALEAASPGAVVALSRLAGQADALAGWIEDEVRRRQAQIVETGSASTFLRRPAEPLHPLLAATLLANVVRDLTSAPGRPAQRIVDALAELWLGGAGRRLSLPGRLRAEATGDGLLLTREPERTSPQLYVRQPLRLGKGEVPGWRIAVHLAAGTDQAADAARRDPRLVAFVQARPEDLSVRFWEPGVRMRPAGMTGSRKLQDIFVDAKLPRAWRRAVPLVYCGEECIWVVGVKRSERATATPRGGDAELCLTFQALPGASAAGDEPVAHSRL